jgi:hypothetical protein
MIESEGGGVSQRTQGEGGDPRNAFSRNSGHGTCFIKDCFFLLDLDSDYYIDRIYKEEGKGGKSHRRAAIHKRAYTSLGSCENKLGLRAYI